MKIILLLALVCSSCTNSKFSKGDFICHKDWNKSTMPDVYYKVFLVKFNTYNLLEWKTLRSVDANMSMIESNYKLCPSIGKL